MRHSASMSRAAAIETAMAHWWNGSPEGQMFSLVVASEGMCFTRVVESSKYILAYLIKKINYISI